MPTKRDMAEYLANVLTWNSRDRKIEQARLLKYHLGREESDVKESYLRWKAINGVTQAEINRHCQFQGLPLLAAA